MHTERWYVKLARGSWDTVMFSSTDRDEADAIARELNTQYQTDEYTVEPHDPAKAWHVQV